jgi:hypothetical protein
MKFTELYYEKVFPIAPYVNEKIGVRMSIEEGEDAKAAIETAREFAEECFNEKYGDLAQRINISFDEPPPTPVVIKETPPPEEQRIADIIAQMNTCKEIKVLETYRFMVKKEPKLQEAYDLKHKELSK